MVDIALGRAHTMSEQWNLLVLALASHMGQRRIRPLGILGFFPENAKQVESNSMSDDVDISKE